MQGFSAQNYEAISAEEYLFRAYKSAAIYEEKTFEERKSLTAGETFVGLGAAPSKRVRAMPLKFALPPSANETLDVWRYFTGRVLEQCSC
jgi:hypothetical protein